MCGTSKNAEGTNAQGTIYIFFPFLFGQVSAQWYKDKTLGPIEHRLEIAIRGVAYKNKTGVRAPAVTKTPAKPTIPVVFEEQYIR